MTALSDLVKSLQPENGLRCRTGLALVSLDVLDDLANTGARHGIDALDYAAIILKELPDQTQFVALSPDSEEERLLRIANAESGSPVLLITQFDVALARLGAQERGRLWQTIFQYLTQTRHGLIFALPASASRLLPDETTVEQLRVKGRIALIED